MISEEMFKKQNIDLSYIKIRKDVFGKSVT